MSKSDSPEQKLVYFKNIRRFDENGQAEIFLHGPQVWVKEPPQPSSTGIIRVGDTEIPMDRLLSQEEKDRPVVELSKTFSYLPKDFRLSDLPEGESVVTYALRFSPQMTGSSRPVENPAIAQFEEKT